MKRYLVDKNKTNIPTPVKTRWFTCLKNIQRLIEYKNAIKSTCEKHSKDCHISNKVLEIVNNENNWKKFHELEKILQPFCDSQKILESETSNPADVLFHWNQLYKVVNEMKFSILYSSIFQINTQIYFEIKNFSAMKFFFPK